MTGCVNKLTENTSSEPGSQFGGRKVLFVVTGGIAAYKTCSIVREFIRSGGDAQVIMTAAAKQFVTPLTFATLSGKPVHCDLFPEPAPHEPIHLTTAAWSELVVIAPCSADFIAKMAHGLADDLPSTVLLAFQDKILCAPAMNAAMWQNAAVQANIDLLRNRGIEFVGPETGLMGGIREKPGIGRMSEPEVILDRMEELLSTKNSFGGKRVLVTSGPTRESLDPVRYISNHSSGRMGDTIARRARLRGAEVTLVRGKGSSGSPPRNVEVIMVDTASEMATAVKKSFESCDLLIMTAAVADWCTDNVSPLKLKKHTGPPQIEWRQTGDILAWAGKNRTKQTVVGFALETEHHIDGARQKLTEKGVDLIALNDPTQSHSAFGGDTIQLTLITLKQDPLELPVLSKSLAADKLLDVVEDLIESNG